MFAQGDAALPAQGIGAIPKYLARQLPANFLRLQQRVVEVRPGTVTLDSGDQASASAVVIAVGACTLSGGPFHGSAEITEGLDQLLPVDLYIPGCPPHPLTNLHALLTYFK